MIRFGGPRKPRTIRYDQSLAEIHDEIARMTRLVDRNFYPRSLLDAYVAAARQRQDWTEPA